MDLRSVVDANQLILDKSTKLHPSKANITFYHTISAVIFVHINVHIQIIIWHIDSFFLFRLLTFSLSLFRTGSSGQGLIISQGSVWADAKGGGYRGWAITQTAGCALPKRRRNGSLPRAPGESHTLICNSDWIQFTDVNFHRDNFGYINHF